MAETIIDKTVANSMTEFKAYFDANLHVNPLTGNPYTIDISYPNITYTPDPEQPYIAYYIVPSDTSQRTLGTNAPNTHLGFIQIDLYVVADSGTKMITDVVDDLKPYFRRGTYATLAGSDYSVEYLNFTVSRGENSDTHYRKIITVNYRSVLPNY